MRGASIGRIVNIEEGIVEGIPTLFCLPERAARCPVVFYCPGFGGSKEHGLALAHRLAQKGIAAVCFDPLYHGARYDERIQRAGDPAFGGVYPPESGLDTFLTFYQVIRQSALDVATLLDRLAGDARLDVDRAGITGMSMGAYASFLAFAEIPGLTVAVPMMGVPTFTRRWLDLLHECAWSNPAWATALAQVAASSEQHTTWITGFDPADHLRQATPRALLVMSGDFDSDQPKHYVLDWFGAMRAAYQATPERLQWNIYPVGHTVTAQMEADAVGWLALHLAPIR